ncbi:hypothetical protein EO087_05475 [Dyella sp. M7H15-1]|uniref:hypothetical protein n=1 Tax=Dyella sp. M7H15-1 TaxID=2501295 RepID=UPI001005020E|nr:hypothetical protein [Dyella sp. M7H15-1]QAU23499.1 hypothetical protein EO087_05475 [Dyella sp. M7H15-1]
MMNINAKVPTTRLPAASSKPQSNVSVVVATGNDQITVRGPTLAKDDAMITAQQGAKVTAHDRVFVSAGQGAEVWALDNATVHADPGSTVSAFDKATVYAHRGATVNAEGESTVIVYPGADVTVHSGATAVLEDGAQLVAHKGAVVKLGEGVELMVTADDARLHAIGPTVIVELGSVDVNHGLALRLEGENENGILGVLGFYRALESGCVEEIRACGRVFNLLPESDRAQCLTTLLKEKDEHGVSRLSGALAHSGAKTFQACMKLLAQLPKGARAQPAAVLLEAKDAQGVPYFHRVLVLGGFKEIQAYGSLFNLLPEGDRAHYVTALLKAKDAQDVPWLSWALAHRGAKTFQTCMKLLAQLPEGARVQPAAVLLEASGAHGVPCLRWFLADVKLLAQAKPAYTTADLIGRPVRLGSGATNTVFAVQLKKPDGSTFECVFKPLSRKMRDWGAGITGIPRDNPQTAMRNLATVSYAKKLGFDVVVDTSVGVFDFGPGPGGGYKQGLVMERARGTSAANTNLGTLTRADVCAEVTKLQLLDHLTGQCDRHDRNYFISIENDQAKVRGIDNDVCFGEKLTDPNGIKFVNNAKQYGFRGTSMPPVVDTDMATKINALTPDDIRGILGDKLSEAEVQAAIKRLDGVKQHIAQLKAQGKVIDSRQWSNPRVQQLLTEDNSYVGRDKAYAATKLNTKW